MKEFKHAVTDNTSESTVRRDITALDKMGKLTKVFGGAVSLENVVTAYEPTMAQKSDLNTEEKNGSPDMRRL